MDEVGLQSCAGCNRPLDVDDPCVEVCRDLVFCVDEHNPENACALVFLTGLTLSVQVDEVGV